MLEMILTNTFTGGGRNTAICAKPCRGQQNDKYLLSAGYDGDLSALIEGNSSNRVTVHLQIPLRL